MALILVSHSAQIAEGAADLVRQMAGEVEIHAVGGGPDGDLGTDPERIQNAIESARAEEILVFVDIGSAVLSTEAVVDMLDEDLKSRVHLADAPIIEGAFAAGVTASTGADAEECLEAAAEARTTPKLHD